MSNVIAALPNIGGALYSTPQSLADAHYYSAMQHVSDLHSKFANATTCVEVWYRHPICDGGE